MKRNTVILAAIVFIGYSGWVARDNVVYDREVQLLAAVSRSQTLVKTWIALFVQSSK